MPDNTPNTESSPSTPTRTFEHSRKALAAYDAGSHKRMQRWERADTEEQIQWAEAAYTAALLKLRDAFYQDTKDLNSRKHCAVVPASAIRDCVLRCLAPATTP